MNDSSPSLDWLWHCPNYNQLRIRVWEEEYFVFNPNSGDTHLLNIVSMEILELLGTTGHTLDTLAEILLDQVDNPELMSRHLRDHLEQLRELGLLNLSPQ